MRYTYVFSICPAISSYNNQQFMAFIPHSLVFQNFHFHIAYHEYTILLMHEFIDVTKYNVWACAHRLLPIHWHFYQSGRCIVNGDAIENNFHYKIVLNMNCGDENWLLPFQLIRSSLQPELYIWSTLWMSPNEFIEWKTRLRKILSFQNGRLKLIEDLK